MTNEEFEEARLTIMWYIADLGDKAVDKLRLGMIKQWKNYMFKLYLLERHFDILLEYTPQTEEDYDDDNTNFFTIEEMLEIQQKINEILNTDFALDFYLDE